MRVTFTQGERLEMAIAMWGSLGLRYSLFPALVLGMGAVPAFLFVLAVVSVAVSHGCFVVPGKTFVQKAAVVALALVVAVRRRRCNDGGVGHALVRARRGPRCLPRRLGVPRVLAVLAVRLFRRLFFGFPTCSSASSTRVHRLQALLGGLSRRVLRADRAAHLCARQPRSLRGVHGVRHPVPHRHDRQRGRAAPPRGDRGRVKAPRTPTTSAPSSEVAGTLACGRPYRPRPPQGPTYFILVFPPYPNGRSTWGTCATTRSATRSPVTSACAARRPPPNGLRRVRAPERDGGGAPGLDPADVTVRNIARCAPAEGARLLLRLARRDGHHQPALLQWNQWLS